MKIRYFIFLFAFILLVAYLPYPEISPEKAYLSPEILHCKNFCEGIFGYSPLGESLFHLIFWGSLNTIVFGLSARMLAVLASLLFMFAILGIWKGISTFTMKIADIIITLPVIFIAVSLMILSHGNALSAIFAVGLAEWAFNIKWLISRAVEYANPAYVQYSFLTGGGTIHQFHYHHWPELKEDIVRLFQIFLPESLLAIAALEFLGVSGEGFFPADGLGYQIAAYKDLLFLYPHLVFIPVAVLVGILLVANAGLNRFKND